MGSELALFLILRVNCVQYSFKSFSFFLELITWSMGDKIITLSKRRTSSVYISVQH